MKNKYCKGLYQQKNIQMAIGLNNELYIRACVPGKYGDGWSSWVLIDLNPAKWNRLDESRVKPTNKYEDGVQTLSQDFVDIFETTMNLYNK